MSENDQEEISRLRAINEELESDLLETQDQLLSLTEKENDVPEKSIKDAYLAIIRGVNFWIDDVSGHKEFNFRPKWLEHSQRRNRKELLEDLGFDARCHEIAWQKKLGEMPSAHYTFLSLVIVKVLRHRVFDRSRTDSIWGAIYPLGLNDKYIKLVEELQQAMGSEELGREESQILRWRGETISAMNSQQKCRERLDREIDGILKALAKGLDEWLDHRVLQDRKKSLLQYVIEPVVEFAQLAGCAHKNYILEVENFVLGPVADSCSWNIRDVSNWRQITPGEAQGVFHCLWPMLVRKGTASQPDNQLVQPIMIGYSDGGDITLPELVAPGTSGEPAKSSMPRGDDTARSRKSTSPSKKSSLVKHGGRTGEKEPWSLRNLFPANSTSSSKSRDPRPGRRADPSTRRPSIESPQAVVGPSTAYPTEEQRHAHFESDEDYIYDPPYRQTARRQFR